MRSFTVQAEPLGHKLSIRLGRKKGYARVGGKQREEGFPIKVVGMVMARGDKVYEVQLSGLNRKLRHADMRLVGAGVLFCQRIREVGVDQEKPVLPPEKKAALPQPPEMETTLVGRGGRDIS